MFKKIKSWVQCLALRGDREGKGRGTVENRIHKESEMGNSSLPNKNIKYQCLYYIVASMNKRETITTQNKLFKTYSILKAKEM